MVPRIDLIALDLDGTLLNSSDHITAANRAAIAASLQAGIRVVIVTGRGADAAGDVARGLGLNLPIICAHGALTKDVMSGKVLGHIPVPLQYAMPMIEFAEQNAIDAAVYVEERFHRLSGMPPYMNDMRGPHWVEVESLARVLTSAPTFLRFFGRDAVEAMRETFADFPLHFKYETWGEFEELAVTSIDATKKNALARLCADLKISSKHVMAVGDSRNDVPMLRWAAIGVAMANALPEVRNAVQYVTTDNNADGVAAAIERFVLEPLDEEKKTA
ncbi:MAG TPA: HAD-IIB family hydrolase [Candidatus Aquilonibacter sp.]|nr:HAD-IIB family hydrolase [Candidatus Aquilonibacter sp.]